MKESIRNDETIVIGRNIRRIRKEKQMRSKDLVTRLQLKGVNITIWSLCKIEAGRQHITASQLKAAAEMLGVDCMELLQETGDEMNEEDKTVSITTPGAEDQCDG